MTTVNARRRQHGYGRNSIPRRRVRRRDAVTPELHQAVWDRDGECIAGKVLSFHTCSGGPSVDHFWWISGGKRSKRAPSRLEHLVAMCRDYNVAGPSREVRQAEREYARTLYPSHGTETGCVCDAV